VSKKEFEMFGAVGWAGEVDGKPAVITVYKNGSSIWLYQKKLFRRGKWVRIEYPSRDEAMNAAGATE
jgi:hypothetical protein